MYVTAHNGDKIRRTVRNRCRGNKTTISPPLYRFTNSVLGGVSQRGAEDEAGGPHERPLSRRDGKRQRVLRVGLTVGPGENGCDQGECIISPVADYDYIRVHGTVCAIVVVMPYGAPRWRKYPLSDAFYDRGEANKNSKRRGSLTENLLEPLSILFRKKTFSYTWGMGGIHRHALTLSFAEVIFSGQMWSSLSEEPQNVSGEPLS